MGSGSVLLSRSTKVHPRSDLRLDMFRKRDREQKVQEQIKSGPHGHWQPGGHKDNGNPQGRSKMEMYLLAVIPKTSQVVPWITGFGLSCPHKAENTLNTHQCHYSESGIPRHTHGSLLVLKWPISDGWGQTGCGRWAPKAEGPDAALSQAWAQTVYFSLNLSRLRDAMTVSCRVPSCMFTTTKRSHLTIQNSH